MLDEVPPALRVARATDPRRRCAHTIELQGRIYCCGRHAHDTGIHDAFCAAPDGKAVRW